MSGRCKAISCWSVLQSASDDTDTCHKCVHHHHEVAAARGRGCDYGSACCMDTALENNTMEPMIQELIQKARSGLRTIHMRALQAVAGPRSSSQQRGRRRSSNGAHVMYGRISLYDFRVRRLHRSMTSLRTSAGARATCHSSYFDRCGRASYCRCWRKVRRGLYNPPHCKRHEKCSVTQGIFKTS